MDERCDQVIQAGIKEETQWAKTILKNGILAGCAWPDGKSHPGFSFACHVYVVCHFAVVACYVAKKPRFIQGASTSELAATHAGLEDEC